MLGARIAALRRESGLSQQQLAERLGCSTSAIGMYEQGRREPPGKLIVALAATFGVTTDYLLTGKLTQPCDERALGRIVRGAEARLSGELLLRGADGTARAVSRDDLATLLAAVLG